MLQLLDSQILMDSIGPGTHSSTLAKCMNLEGVVEFMSGKHMFNADGTGSDGRAKVDSGVRRHCTEDAQRTFPHLCHCCHLLDLGNEACLEEGKQSGSSELWLWLARSLTVEPSLNMGMITQIYITDLDRIKI